MRHVCIRRTVIFLAIVAAAACGDDDNRSSGTSPIAPTPAPTSTTFQGTIAGSAGSSRQSGTLTVTVQAQVAAVRPLLFRWPLVATLHAQSSASASGTLRLAGGSTTSLSGTYDSTSRALSLSGSGFAFAGSFSSGVMTGSYTGSNGASGAFSTRSTAAGPVTVYCGNIFSAGNPNEITGVLNLVVSEGTGAVSGVFTITADTPPTSGSIVGQVTGSALSFTYTATSGRFAPGSGTATGTIQGGSVNGTSESNNRFSGSTSACQ